MRLKVALFTIIMLTSMTTQASPITSIIREIFEEVVKSAAGKLGEHLTEEFMKLFNTNKKLKKDAKSPKLKKKDVINNTQNWVIVPGSLTEKDILEIASILKRLDKEREHSISYSTETENKVITTQDTHVQVITRVSPEIDVKQQITVNIYPLPPTPSLPPPPPLPSPQLPWSFKAGVSYFHFNPNLPRDLTIHETHPDDKPFLPGSAGQTDLSSVKVVFLDLSGEYSWNVFPSLEWGLKYCVKVPLNVEGRKEKQNENDYRPPTEGSFIYSQINKMNAAHEVGAFMTYHIPRESIGLLIKPGVYIGYWQMRFEKGWDRFGKDQTSLSSDANGLSLSPQIDVVFGKSSLGVSINAAYRFMRVKYETTVLGSTTAQGWEIGTAVFLRL